MKKVFIITLSALMFVSATAFAEEYFECKLTGQSDSAASAPKKVSLDKSKNWSLNENNKKVRNISVKESRQGYTVKHPEIKNRQVTEYNYDFDNTKCESHQTGKAVLNIKLIGASDSGATAHPISSTHVYDCTCGVD